MGSDPVSPGKTPGETGSDLEASKTEEIRATLHRTRPRIAVSGGSAASPRTRFLLLPFLFADREADRLFLNHEGLEEHEGGEGAHPLVSSWIQGLEPVPLLGEDRPIGISSFLRALRDLRGESLPALDDLVLDGSGADPMFSVVHPLIPRALHPKK